MTPIERLRAAREYLTDPRRWRKFGTPPADPEALCVFTAVVRPGFRWDCIPALDTLARTVGLPGYVPMAIQNWNDAPERTHAEALAGLDDAIAALAAS